MSEVKFMRAQSWSDNDRYFGPFTLAYPDCHRVGWVLVSGHDEYPGCHLRLHCLWFSILVALPPILRPYRERRWPGWDAETVSRLGQDYYDVEYAREFGLEYFEGALHVHYGRQTHDSTTDRAECFFLPWTNWRHVRHSYYAPDHSHFWTEPFPASKLDEYDWLKARDECPSITFEFDDYDGERIQARCIIEEREWRFGTGWCKWLSWFVPAKIHRILDILFSSGTGRSKGSWNSGTVLNSIEIAKGESPESAFRRYCRKHEMEYVGKLHGGKVK